MATASLADSLSHFLVFLSSETALGWMLVGRKVTLVPSHTLHLCKYSHEDNSALGHCSKLPEIKRNYLLSKTYKQKNNPIKHTHTLHLPFFLFLDYLLPKTISILYDQRQHFLHCHFHISKPFIASKTHLGHWTASVLSATNTAASISIRAPVLLVRTDDIILWFFVAL